MRSCTSFVETPKLIQMWNIISEKFFWSLRCKLLHTVRDGLSAAGCSVLNGFWIWTKNAEQSEIPRLAASDKEHKLKNVAKEYFAFFLYKNPAKGITLYDNEQVFKLDVFFLQH